MSIRRWLHRHGLLRLLNRGSDNTVVSCSALVEVRAPRPLAVRAAAWVAVHDDNATLYLPDRDSARVRRVQHIGTLRYRVLVDYRRAT